MLQHRCLSTRRRGVEVGMVRTIYQNSEEVAKVRLLSLACDFFLVSKWVLCFGWACLRAHRTRDTRGYQLYPRLEQ
jgi:hypothetical protein